MQPQLFIVPAAEAAPSGGNLFNHGLLAALATLLPPPQRALIQRSTPDALPEHTRSAFGVVWLDSLYLERAPALRAALPQRTRLQLIAHALPSDLAQAAGRPAFDLIARERAWLSAFGAALVPSSTMAESIHQRLPTLRCHELAPAVHALAPQRSDDLAEPRALIIANLVANKGVLPFLEALETVLATDDRFTLRIVGGDTAEPAYAAACRARIAGSRVLSARVVLCGALPFTQVLDELSRAHIVLSPSRSESFGLAVADACASGCVVLALRAGHVARLVSAQAGGQLLADDMALADALLALVREPELLRVRLAQAAAHALPTRSWHDVGAEFLARFERARA